MLRRLIAHAGLRVCAAFSAGILLGRSTGPSVTALFIAASCVWVAAATAHLSAGRLTPLRHAGTMCITVLCMLTGMLLIRLADRSIDTTLMEHADTNAPMIFAGTVASDPVDNGVTLTFRFQCDTLIDGSTVRRVDAATAVTMSADTARAPTRRFSEGDRLRLRGKLATPRPLRNPGSFDARGYALQQGRTTEIRVSGPDGATITAARSGFRLMALFSGIRHALFTRLEQLNPGTDSDLLRGLLFGDRSRIDREISRDFRDSGVIHILSVSGTHVGILVAIIWLLLGRVPMTFRVGIAVTMLWSYALLTDLSPPVLRSVVMATMFLAAMPLQRITSAVNTWALSGLALLVFSPADLYSPSFQLSFSAVLSILLFHQRIVAWAERRMPRLTRRALYRHIVIITAMTFVAQLGTFPFLVMYFRQISIVSFAANLVIVPLTSFVMATSLAALAFSCVWTFPATLLADATHAGMAGTVSLSAWFARVPFAVVTVQSMPVWAAVGYGIGALWVYSIRRRMRYRLTIAAAAIAAALSVTRALETASPSPALLRIVALDVSQGDALVVQAPDGTAMLIDAGASSARGDEGERTVVPALRALGIDSLAMLLVTHFDDDHVGGAASVLAALPVGVIAAPPADSADAAAWRLRDLARQRHITWLTVNRGARLPLSPMLRCDALAPLPGETRRGNPRSIVLAMRYGSTQLLCSGDCPIDVENDIVRAYGSMLRSQLYKVGHHGSKTSTGDALLRAVAPAYALISCGRFNRFSHPSPAVVQRLARSGVRVHRTDVSGAAMYVSDGRKLWQERWQ
jgi:competence protein ComEC